jgi:signal transduction histidine kinase
MILKDIPIQRKLMRVILLTSGIVLLLTSAFYFAYEVFTFRHTTVRQLSILGKIIANNSTAALAFDSQDDANEILAALKAEPHIVAAGIYDMQGNIFSSYPPNYPTADFPTVNENESYGFENSYLIGFQPIVQGGNRLGTLYLKSDMGAIYERFQLYGGMGVVVIAISFLVAYLISKNLQQVISKPILALAETANAIANHQDYSVRVLKSGNDEIGLLTDAFNQMLTQIQSQNLQIQLFNQKLEQSIIERTRELEVANKELEAFSYSVSHDLRAPLRSIDGYSRVLIEDYGEKLDDEGKRTLKVIMKNALKMGHLIDDLLAFSRLGKLNVTKVNLDMNSLIRGVVEEFKAQYRKEATININPLLSVQGDRSMLKQALGNLIGNALKYSMKKEQSIVEIGSFAENDSVVYFVKDNGAGFDMQYYDKLFGVFQRLHSANEFEGTGVGLALVHRIITKHGGKVWAEGKIDEGATFYFSLPIS